MMNSNRLSPPLSKAGRILSIVFLVVAFLGFVDAAYLTVHHYIAIPLPCTILNGCEVVTTSAYSTLGPIPIALLGALYYGCVFFLMLLYRETKQKAYLITASWLVGGAFAVSVWLVYLQGYVLHSWCQYCLVSAVFTTLLTVLSVMLWRSERVHP